MQGSIRIVVGMLILFGVAGGIDVASDVDLVFLGVFAVIGGLFMASGVKALNT